MPTTYGNDRHLIAELQAYVARDINSKLRDTEETRRVVQDDVVLVSFNRIFFNWKATLSCPHLVSPEVLYEMTHEGYQAMTIVRVHSITSTHEAII